MHGFRTDPTAPGGVRLVDDLPEPEPASGELLLAVRAYALNRGELSLIEQRPDGWRPGQDVAGVVLRAAVDGSGPAEGARVVARLDQHGWAERVALPARSAFVLTDEVSFEQAATLPIAAVTALRALRQGGAVLGADVLVTGASGGVGQFAVQLAVAAGARVTALVSSASRVPAALALGAHHVVTDIEGSDLDGSDLDGGRGPHSYQLVLDGVGGPGLAKAIRLLAPQGTAVVYGRVAGPTELSISDFYAQGWNGRLVGLISAETADSGASADAAGYTAADRMAADLAILTRLVADGRLRPQIGRVDDWSRTPDALTALAAGEVRGKAVLTVPASAPARPPGGCEPLLDRQL